MIKVQPQDENQAVKIKVIGVGGAGGNAVSRMVERLNDVDLIAVNTDTQALNVCRAPIKLQIGERLTGGRGTGANPDTGKYCAEEDRGKIQELVKGSDVVFLTLGLGGGTGTGAGPLIGKIARASGAVVIGFVTIPFDHQGAWRISIAREGLDLVRDCVDTLIVVPNQKIFEVVEEDIPLESAYGMIDEILYQGVSGISDLITKVGIENLDFADVESIMKNGGEGLIGTGKARGEGRAEEAARLTIANPFLKREELTGARNVLISVSAAEPGFRELNRVVKVINEALAPTSKTFCGAVIDERMEDNLKVTLIATGLETRSGSTTETTMRKPPDYTKPAGKRNGQSGSLFNNDQEYEKPAANTVEQDEEEKNENG